MTWLLIKKRRKSNHHSTIEDDLPFGCWFNYGEQLGASTLFFFNFTEWELIKQKDNYSCEFLCFFIWKYFFYEITRCHWIAWISMFHDPSEVFVQLKIQSTTLWAGIEKDSEATFFLAKVCVKSQYNTGWQMLGDRGTCGPRKVRVFSERMDPQHTLFCRET